MMKKLIAVVSVLVGFTVMSFAGVSWVGNSYMFIKYNNATTWYTGSNNYLQPGGKFQSANIGIFNTNFELGGELEVYEKQSTDATMFYKIDNGSIQNISLPKNGDVGNNSKHYGIGTVSITNLSNGQHTISVWFHHSGVYDSNNSNNYVANFTVAKPSITLTASPSVAFINENITLSTYVDNIDNYTISYSVKTPGASTFTSINPPYTPKVTGEYTFKAELKKSGDNTVLDSDEKTVNVYHKITTGTRLYLKPNTNWRSDDARFAAYYFYFDEDNVKHESWVDMTYIEVHNDYPVYEAIAPEGTWSNVIFTRMNPNNPENSFSTEDEGNKPFWNKTKDLFYNGIDNCYQIESGSWNDGNGTWSLYTIPTKTFTVTVPQGTEKVYIAGTFHDKYWKINAVDNPYELQATADPRVFTGTFQCGSDIQYKYLNGTDDSDYYEGTDNLELTGGAGSKPKSRANRFYNASDEVKHWVASPKIKLEVTFADGVEVPSNLYVKGDWNDWGDATELTFANGKFSTTINQKVYANTAYKYRANHIVDNNWEIRKVSTTQNPNNKINDRWAIYPALSDKIIGFVTDSMIHIGRKSISGLKLDTDLKITIPDGATVKYTLTTNDYSEDEPVDEYNSSNGFTIETVGVYYLKNQLFHNDSSYFKQVPINLGPITWKDNGNTTWGATTNWTINNVSTNRSPITKEDVVIPSSLSNYPVLNTDANIGSLEIASGAKLTINPESELHVEGKITNNNGTSGIMIKADLNKATGTLLFNNPVNEPVQATVEMYARGSWDVIDGKIKNTKWQYFGIPFTHIDNIEHPFYGAVIREHNQAGTQSTSVLPNISGKWIQLNNYSSLAPIKGYEIAQPVPKTYVLSGTLYKGDFTYNVAYTSGVSLAGQHIISNPYMAAIPISDAAITFSENMDKTVYIYNTGSYSDFVGNSSKTGNNAGQYTASPLFITNSSSGIPEEIAPMQGFLVRTDKDQTTAGSIAVSYTNLKKNTAIHRAPKAPQPWLRLVVNAESGSGDALWLFTNPDTSPAFDNGWDARKMASEAVYPMIFSYNQTGNYQVNTMDDIDNTDIAFRAGSADTDYTITFNHGDGMMAKYVDVYCEDLETGTIIDISEDGTTYNFQSSTINIHSRFKIHASKVISDVDDMSKNQNVYVYADGKNLIINNASKDPSRIDLYDTLGRLLVSYQVQGGEMQSYQPNVPQGTYIVKLTNSTVETYKVMLK